MSYSSIQRRTCQISPIRSMKNKTQWTKHRKESSCNKTCCLVCIMNEPDPPTRRSGLTKCFIQLHQTHQDNLIVTLSRLWSIALSEPDDAEFPSLGIFECMARLIQRCINDRKWLSRGKNVYIPYYAAHIIGSYTMNKAEQADLAVKSNVVPALMELLRGKISWVEQRVAVRALGHIASHKRAFKALVVYEEEIIHLTIKISSTCFATVYAEFDSSEQPEYHRDLLTRGRPWPELENKKAEGWACQLQSWSLYLLNCFATQKTPVHLICEKESFLKDLCGMWGGLQNASSFSGVWLIRSICLTKDGRRYVANSKEVMESLCNLCRSSDEWQHEAIESVLLLLQDPETRFEVIELVVHYMLDLVELKSIKNVGDTITLVLLQDYGRIKYGKMVLKDEKSQKALEEVWNLKVERRRADEMMSEHEFRERKVMVGMLKREGNEKFWLGETEEAVAKYSKALELCPLKMKEERIVLYSNRSQCRLLQRKAEMAISDTTRALSLSGFRSPHMKSLWRRSQAYDMLGMARQSLMDCSMFIHRRNTMETKRQAKASHYAVRMLNKQISATNPFGLSHSANAKRGEDRHPGP